MRLIDRLRSHAWQNSAEAIFRLVYGRGPTHPDRALLANAVDRLRKGDSVGAFRCIVNGGNHLASPTAFTVRFSPDDIAYLNADGFYLAVDTMDMSVGQLVLAGAYEPHLMKFYRARLKPGMVFVDVGANIGLYSMLAAQMVGPAGSVLCFEPNSENCRLIMLSASKNGVSNVAVYPVALGGETGHALFTTHIGSNGGLIPDTLNSLLNTSCTVVPQMQLESMVHGRVDMMKVDVEGAEGRVIAGAAQIIERYRPVITSEFSLEMLGRVSRMPGLEYLEYFQKHHYELYLIDRGTQELVPIHDPRSFIDSYGEVTRIEDLAFIPR